MSKNEGKGSSTTVEPPLTPPRTPPSQPPTPSDEPAEVKEAVQIALDLLKYGEHEKALNLINESISRHPSSARLHFVKGTLHLSIANVYTDDAKAKHLEDGIRSAQFVTEIRPNSVPCVLLLDDLHKELAVFNKKSESKIESPTDYEMKDLFGEDLSQDSRFDDDMKWLEDVKSPKNLEFVAKKEDSEVMEADRRKKQSKAIMKKLKDNNEDISKYKQFWNSITLSDEKKRGFRKVNIEELKNHIKSLKDKLAMDLLLEAIDFAKQHKSWTFWECYDCVKKFSDYKLFGKHFWQVHWMDSRSMWKLDEELWIESIDMIEKGVWKPFDTNEAIKLISNPMKSEKGFDECKGSSVVEVPGKISKSDDKESSKTTMDAPKWAFCDDIERIESLRRIRRILFLLRKNKCLSPVLVQWALEYAKDQFESIIPLSQYKDLGLKRLQVICFLGASQLTEMLTFLEDVAHTCGLSENIELGSSMDDKLSDHHVFDIKEKVLFSREFTCLLVDERVFQGKLNATNYFDAVAGDGSAVRLSAVADVPVRDDIVSWLYMGSNCGEGLVSWKSLLESRKSQVVKSQTACLEKLSVIPQTSAENDEISSKLTAIQKLENMLLEEIEKEKNPENELHLYMDLLKERQMELEEIEDTSKRSELGAISEILEKAQEVERGDQSGFEGCSVEDESRMQEGAKQRDNCINIALKQLKMQLFKQLSCHDVINLRRVVALQQYVQELTNKTVCDYRSIVVPMLKSLLQSHLKDLYEKAEEKAKAAVEELLVEMAVEADKVSADVRQNQDKKKKKKKKKNQKPETSKESVLHQKDEEEYYSLDELKQQSTASDEKLALLAEMALEADKVSADVKQNQDKKKKKKKKKKNKNKNPETSKESEAIDASEHIELHQKDEEQNHNQDCKNDDSLNELKQSTVADKARMLDGHLEILRRFEHEVSQCQWILKTRKKK
ncbi:hypothetical protein Q3G72_003647 [Acer saccharum]|nr:hypothetical protein Q3G72_003647 [Acer saccharum]